MTQPVFNLIVRSGLGWAKNDWSIAMTFGQLVAASVIFIFTYAKDENSNALHGNLGVLHHKFLSSPPSFRQRVTG
jgi:hypothetical protein